MKPYEKHESIVALMDRANVDTDQIIPKQFLKKVERAGFGVHLFFDWRYLPNGDDNPEFELNNPAFKGAGILLAGDNFGCGSSREHAPWAIADYGFNTVISTSYADIFYNNCFKNSILPIVVSKSVLEGLMHEVAGTVIKFEIDTFRKENLLKGLDDIGLTLAQAEKISTFEANQKQAVPWLWT
jgi:3-isopropylmalate/(R)-2-methylmalate dehydratase small subunit